jgi:hypothetical protein
MYLETVPWVTAVERAALGALFFAPRLGEEEAKRQERTLVLDPGIILWQDLSIHKTLQDKHLSHSLTNAIAER